MLSRRFKRRGPRLFGYEPGWLWWAVVLVIFLVSGLTIRSELARQEKGQAFIDERIAYHATEQGLDVSLVRAVVEAESSFDWEAESNKNAKGLMQITPIALADVQRLMDVPDGNLFDVDYNLEVGTLYLSYLIDRFDGDVTLAVAAYHMGPTRVAKGMRKYPKLSSSELVKKVGGPQTRAYVKKVMRLYEGE